MAKAELHFLRFKTVCRIKRQKVNIIFKIVISPVYHRLILRLLVFWLPENELLHLQREQVHFLCVHHVLPRKHKLNTDSTELHSRFKQQP